MIGTFTATDLLKYVSSLLKNTRLLELRSEESNYSWLKSKHPRQDDSLDVLLEEFKPIILKLSPESCTTVAVKLDILTEQSMSTEHILTTLKTLLQEQDSLQIMAGTVKRAKETKNRKIKVHPELTAGRQPTVSFVVYSNKGFTL